MKKLINKQFIGWIIGVFILFPLFVLLYNKITVRKNDGEKYFNDYYSKIKPFTLSVPSNEDDNLPNVEANYDSYRKGTENAQSQRVNPNEGPLNNPLNRNKFKTQENQIKARYGKRNYRRSQEWVNLQREKAEYNRYLGQKELTSRHNENLKKGARGFVDGFNPKTPAGGLFWAGTILKLLVILL